MKSALRNACLLVAMCAGVANSAETLEFNFEEIQSLDTIQGHWGIAPQGLHASGGIVLDIEGQTGFFRTISDIPRPGNRPKKVDLEVVDGMLILKTDSAQVDVRKWRLARIGQYKCLVGLQAIEKGRHVSVSTNVVYLNPAE